MKMKTLFIVKREDDQIKPPRIEDDLMHVILMAIYATIFVMAIGLICSYVAIHLNQFNTNVHRSFSVSYDTTRQN